MNAHRIVLTVGLSLLGPVSLAAQVPVLSTIESPYPAIQATVHVAGGVYGPGIVSYGPPQTPLTLTGSYFGGSGTVWFTGYAKVNNVEQSYTPVAGSVISWTATKIVVSVPSSSALTGLVTVSVGGHTSNPLPFMVTQGTFLSSCSRTPPATQLAVTTDSLPSGMVGTSYSTSLSATGGTPPYTWSLSGTSLPAGLSLSSGGSIAGTPTALTSDDSVSFTVTDSLLNTANVVLDVSVGESVPNQYIYTATYDGAGNVQQYVDSVMGTWNFGYDKLNRLTSASPIANQPADYTNQNVCMAYDNFGNRTAYTQQSAACPAQESSLTPTMSYGTNNQITGGLYVYDASGDVTQKVGYNFLYDAEGRICAVNNGYGYTGYIYNAEGIRVAKGAIGTWSCNPATNGFTLTESYVLGPDGEELTMIGSGSTGWQRTNVYGQGKLLATYDTAGLHFHLSDPLGSRRMQTNDQGVAEQDCESLPFGDQALCHQDPNAIESTADATPLHFTGKERDTESGNDYFDARYYSSAMGRFMSPDWSAKEEPVPYAKLDDPQTLNLYSYVQNNPLSLTDPTGHGVCDLLPCPTAEDWKLIDAAGARAAGWATAARIAAMTGGIYGLAMAFPEALPGGKVGQSEADEIAQRDELDRENQAAEPQAASGGARQGGGGLRYENPGHHDPTSPNFVQGKTPLPTDAAAVFGGAIQVTGREAGTGQLAFGVNNQGQIYRYSGQNGALHYSGTYSFKSREVPNQIKKQLQAELKKMQNQQNQ
jgi:RHS repeat-associated protein